MSIIINFLCPNVGLLGQVLGAAELAHCSAEAAFKCYLFRKSSMTQSLILRGLHSAQLRHAQKAEGPDLYKAAFATSPKDQQVGLLFMHAFYPSEGCTFYAGCCIQGRLLT